MKKSNIFIYLTMIVLFLSSVPSVVFGGLPDVDLIINPNPVAVGEDVALTILAEADIIYSMAIEINGNVVYQWDCGELSFCYKTFHKVFETTGQYKISGLVAYKMGNEVDAFVIPVQNLDVIASKCPQGQTNPHKECQGTLCGTLYSCGVNTCDINSECLATDDGTTDDGTTDGGITGGGTILGGAGIDNPLNYDTFGELAAAISKFVFILALAVAPILFAIGGFMIVTARGNPLQVQKAQKLFLYTAVGLVVIVLAQAIFSVIKNVLGVKETTTYIPMIFTGLITSFRNLKFKRSK